MKNTELAKHQYEMDLYVIDRVLIKSF